MTSNAESDPETVARYTLFPLRLEVARQDNILSKTSAHHDPSDEFNAALDRFLATVRRNILIKVWEETTGEKWDAYED